MKPLIPGLVALFCFSAPLVAEQPGLSIELNTAQTDANACTLTFVVVNGHSAPIDKLIYETVLFDKTGQVNRLTLFDFGKLPPALPRVRQFALPDTDCDALGRVLFNGLNACTSADDTACKAGIAATSRTGIEVLG